MSSQLKLLIFCLLLVIIAAASSANAGPISARLAENSHPISPPSTALLTSVTTTTLPPIQSSLPVDVDDQPMPATPGPTTTTTLPIISRCPNGVADATQGSRDGYEDWAFDPGKECPDVPTGTVQTYCFQNPHADTTSSSLVEHKTVVTMMGGTWEMFTQTIMITATQNTDACYVCSCLRGEGCFAPGVKITMADGSLRKIEDVRAGDMVRNAKTGASVKVGKVIEGPEALPLIRFGFDGAVVTTSEAHPVLTAAGLKPANQIKKSDTVFDAQGKPHLVTVLDTLPIEEGQRVINVDLETASPDTNDRLLISDGIVTGDIVLQALLREKQ